jgi:AraC family transcriptional regulator, arabinose operon regulatory protein
MNVDPRIVWAIEEMQRRMGDGVDLTDLAGRVNLSRSRFAHLFREQTGVSPGRYLRDFRLDRARFLLETTFLSVKEVMATVGFNDPSHFSRDFQHTFGASPREWRKRVTRTATRDEVAADTGKPDPVPKRFGPTRATEVR